MEALIVWICPSRNRPENLKRLMAACVDTGMTQEAVIVIDGGDSKYDVNMYLPQNWTMLMYSTHNGMNKQYNGQFIEKPNKQFYGLLADDIVPRTDNWDKLLSYEAGDWNIAYPNDLMDRDRELVTTACIGGKLARAIGYIAPPGLYHLYIDDVLTHIGKELGVLRYRQDIIVEHLHFSNNKAPLDSTYTERRKYTEQDKAFYTMWLNNPRLAPFLASIKEQIASE